MVQTTMMKYTSLYIIAAYLLINGIGGFYQLISHVIKENSTSAIYLPLIFNAGFLIAGIGLIRRKGWGRNFALFFNGISVILGLQHLLIYFYGDAPDTRPIIKGLADFLIAGPIYFYLFKTKIKALFDESPNSLFILGGFLAFYGIQYDSGIALVDFFWLAMAIVGFAMLIKAGQQRKKSMGIIRSFNNANRNKP